MISCNESLLKQGTSSNKFGISLSKHTRFSIQFIVHVYWWNVLIITVYILDAYLYNTNINGSTRIFNYAICFFSACFSVACFFFFQGELKVATIENVFAIIKGREEPDRYVLLGNHRDAWTYGAVDPNSGTAALLDIAGRFSILLRLGWTPRRTIILCSWDAEEFGMVGSSTNLMCIMVNHFHHVIIGY